ncbi:MAG: hypothetical protein RL385_1138, partial [Pseudomonadota bacterium]
MNGPASRSLHALFPLVLGGLLFVQDVHAQDVRDLVREHLDERLEKPRKKKPAARQVQSRTSALTASGEPAAPVSAAEPQPEPAPAPAPEPVASPPPETSPPPEPAPAPPVASAPDPSAHFHLQVGGPEAPEPPANLPRRLMEKWLKIDLTAGAGYRGWRPQQYTNVPVKVGTYYVWTVEVKAKLFRALNLHRGYFES